MSMCLNFHALTTIHLLGFLVLFTILNELVISSDISNWTMEFCFGVVSPFSLSNNLVYE